VTDTQISSRTATQGNGQPETHESRARAIVAKVNKAAGRHPIRIGIIMPLTGPGDPTAGELVVRGAGLGADYIREHGGVDGGRRVESVLYNDQATAAEEGLARSSAAQIRAIRAHRPDQFINDGVIRTNYLIVEQAIREGLLPGTPMMVTFGFPLRSDDLWRLAGPPLATE
jgi:hypothetical protein